MIVLISHLTVKPGTEEECKRLMIAMAEETRKEPGCLLYVAHHSLENPLNFVFYEQYANEAALEAHRAAPYFARYVREGMDKLVVSRNRELFEPLS
jgi:quinol monooxygenase YgiN